MKLIVNLYLLDLQKTAKGKPFTSTSNPKGPVYLIAWG